MPFPILAALGLAGSALSAYGLLKNIASVGDKPSPEEIADAIKSKAEILSRQNGVPMEQAVQAVTEETTKEVQAKHGFDPTAAVFQVLGLAPGVGMLAKGAKIGKEAGTGLMAGLKGVAENQGGIKGALTGGYKADAKTNLAQLRGAGAKGKATPYATPPKKSTAGEEAAEVASPAMRAAHGAEEAGEYAGRSAMAPPPVDPAFAREFPAGTGFTMLESADPANAVGFARRMDAPRIGLGQQNFKTVDVPYEVISPPYNPTLGLPFDEAAAMDEMFRNQLGGIYSQQVRRFPLISDEGRSRATAIMANLQNG